MPFEQKYLTETPKSFKKSSEQRDFGKVEIFSPFFSYGTSSIMDYNKVGSNLKISFLSNYMVGMGMTESFKRTNEYENIMTRQPYKNNLSENYFPENIRQQIKERYGVNVSENPSEEEGKKTLSIIMKDLCNTTESMLSRQKSTNLKLERALEEIEEIQKNW